MKKIIKNVGTVLAWIGTIFFVLLAIIMFDFCSLFFALIAINMLPIQKWKDYKKNKLKIGKVLSIIIGIVLFFVGIMLVPPPDENQSDTLDRNTSTSENLEISKVTNKATSNDETTNIITTTVPKSSFSIQHIEETTTEEIDTTGQILTEPPTETPKKELITETTTESFTEAPNKELVTEPITHDYVINTNTRKFHYSDCRHAKQIQSQNREDTTCTRDSLIAQDYEPCAVCNP